MIPDPVVAPCDNTDPHDRHVHDPGHDPGHRGWIVNCPGVPAEPDVISVGGLVHALRAHVDEINTRHHRQILTITNQLRDLTTKVSFLETNLGDKDDDDPTFETLTGYEDTAATAIAAYREGRADAYTTAAELARNHTDTLEQLAAVLTRIAESNRETR